MCPNLEHVSELRVCVRTYSMCPNLGHVSELRARYPIRLLSLNCVLQAIQLSLQENKHTELSQPVRYLDQLVLAVFWIRIRFISAFRIRFMNGSGKQKFNQNHGKIK